MYYSAKHKVHTRIAFILVSTSINSLFPIADIGVRLWSDHLPVFCYMQNKEQSPCSHVWKLDNILLLVPTITEALGKDIKEYFEFNSACDTSLDTTWDTFKAVLWGEIIAKMIPIRKNKRN